MDQGEKGGGGGMKKPLRLNKQWEFQMWKMPKSRLKKQIDILIVAWKREHYYEIIFLNHCFFFFKEVEE